MIVLVRTFLSCSLEVELELAVASSASPAEPTQRSPSGLGGLPEHRSPYRTGPLPSGQSTADNLQTEPSSWWSTWAASTEPDARAQMDPQVQRLVQAFMLRSPQDSDVEELKWHGTHVHRSLTFPDTPGKP